MPSMYSKEERNEAVREFRSTGLTYEEFSNRMGISRSTFCNWVKAYNKSSSALEENKKPSSFVKVASSKKPSNKGRVSAEINYMGAIIKISGEDGIEAAIRALSTASERSL